MKHLMINVTGQNLSQRVNVNNNGQDFFDATFREATDDYLVECSNMTDDLITAEIGRLLKVINGYDDDKFLLVESEEIDETGHFETDDHSYISHLVNPVETFRAGIKHEMNDRAEKDEK